MPAAVMLQVYLGGFDSEAEAAMAYDLAGEGKVPGHAAGVCHMNGLCCGTCSAPMTEEALSHCRCLLCVAAVKFRGRAAQTNFSLTNYEAELAAMNQVRSDRVNLQRQTAHLVSSACVAGSCDQL